MLPIAKIGVEIILKYVTILLQKDEGERMTIYNAIFARKSVRSYKMEALSENTLKAIRAAYGEMQKLFMGIETELEIVDCLEKRGKIAPFAVKAPYYLVLYTEEKDKCYMNAGYIMEQLSLYLTTKGLGSCFLGMPVFGKKCKNSGDKRYAIALAFGKPKKMATRKVSEFRRLDLNKLCVFKEQPHQWMHKLLEVGRLAPSSMNSQPWRFLVYDNKIHIFSKKTGVATSRRLRDIDFGILCSHMMIAAEELWLDLDLIRLENISQKTFENYDYVLSAVLNV